MVDKVLNWGPQLVFVVAVQEKQADVVDETEAPALLAEEDA